MLTQTEGKIYLNNQRGCTQSNWYRSYHTFNFNTFFSENRKPFYNLKLLNENTLKAKHTLQQEASEELVVCLVPLVGNLNYKLPNEQSKLLEVGESVVFSVSCGESYKISNPYKRALINYLHIEIKVLKKIPLQHSQIELDTKTNQLLPLIDKKTEQFDISLGKYNGRVEGTHKVKNPNKGVFVFVIEGAFEVQDRLLQSRDGLALWTTDIINFEALSNNAIILILDVGTS